MPGVSPDTSIPIPLDTDQVKAGAAADRAIALNVPGMRMAGASWGPALVLPGKAPIIVCFHQSATSNQYGQIALACGLKTVSGVSIMAVGGAIAWDIDQANPPNGGNIIVRMWNPTNGTLLPNRAQEYTAIVVGQA